MYNKMEEYSGYTNKPTWLVSLWIDNDQAEQENTLNVALHIMETEEEEEWIHSMASYLQFYIEESEEAPNKEANLYTGLLNFCLAYVNWTELAKQYLEQAKENLEEA